MIQFPLITIITPSFNQGQFIEETILSVINQTYPHIEYIIVDGGSTDATMDIINKYRDRITTVIHEKDKGQSDAINKGFRIARGQLVGWINSDDLLYSDCIRNLVSYYTNRPNGAVYFNRFNDLIDADGKLIRTYITNVDSRESLLYKNYDVIQQGSFYNTELVRNVGFLNDSIHYCMDLDLWLRLSEHGPIYNVGIKPTAAFRIWESSKTSNGGKKFLSEIRDILFKHGGRTISWNICRIYWYAFKQNLKAVIGL